MNIELLVREVMCMWSSGCRAFEDVASEGFIFEVLQPIQHACVCDEHDCARFATSRKAEKLLAEMAAGDLRGCPWQHTLSQMSKVACKL